MTILNAALPYRCCSLPQHTELRPGYSVSKLVMLINWSSNWPYRVPNEAFPCLSQTTWMAKKISFSENRVVCVHHFCCSAMAESCHI
jgi:hypothetical protein